ncbi:MAG: hypothetical protein RSE41_08045 [Clostridia bacterium]
MKRFIISVFALVLSLSFSINVNATSKCDYKEQALLNSIVANIKASYEEKEGILDRNEYPVPDAVLGTPEEETYVGTYNYFGISILNLTSKFYVVVTNNVNEDTKTFNYSDSVEGVINFDLKNISKVTTFTIKVYSSNETRCANELYRTVYLTTPRLNVYYNYDLCDNAADYYLCKKYVTFPEVESGSFYTQIEKYLDEKNDVSEKPKDENEKWYQKAFNFIKEKKVIFIVSGVSLIVVSGVVIAVIVKKRRSSDL